MRRKIDAALRQAWRERWERFAESGVTVTEFCRREGVSTAAFSQWRKRLTREDASEGKRTADSPAAPRGPAARGLPDRAAGFVELTMPSLAVVELELPNGVRVRVPAEREAALGVAIRAAGGLPSPPGVPDKESEAC